MMDKSGRVGCRGGRGKTPVGIADAGYLEVGFDLAKIAATTSRIQPPTASLLEILMSISRASAAVLTLRDNDADRLRVWVAHNYCPEIIDYATRMDTLCHDMAYRSILQNPAGSPMRTWDDPSYRGSRYCNSPVARQLLLPSGFRGGMSARLTTAEGRHVGNFHMNTRDPFDPDRNEIAAYERSFEVIATFMEKAIRISRKALPYQLTERELQVLERLCAGHTNGTIAAQLGISKRTAEHHVERILEKLAVPTRTAAATVAIREGLLLSRGPSEAPMGRLVHPYSEN